MIHHQGSVLRNVAKVSLYFTQLTNLRCVFYKYSYINNHAFQKQCKNNVLDMRTVFGSSKPSVAWCRIAAVCNSPVHHSDLLRLARHTIAVTKNYSATLHLCIVMNTMPWGIMQSLYHSWVERQGKTKTKPWIYCIQCCILMLSIKHQFTSDIMLNIE